MSLSTYQIIWRFQKSLELFSAPWPSVLSQRMFTTFFLPSTTRFSKSLKNYFSQQLPFFKSYFYSWTKENSDLHFFSIFLVLQIFFKCRVIIFFKKSALFSKILSIHWKFYLLILFSLFYRFLTFFLWCLGSNEKKTWNTTPERSSPCPAMVLRLTTKCDRNRSRYRTTGRQARLWLSLKAHAFLSRHSGEWEYFFYCLYGCVWLFSSWVTEKTYRGTRTSWTNRLSLPAYHIFPFFSPPFRDFRLKGNSQSSKLNRGLWIP